MSRVKTTVVRRARHKKLVKLAQGYRGRSKNCFRIAKQRVQKALQYSYRDRRNKKREFRSLWIQRINAATRQHNVTYSFFMKNLRLSGYDVNRKILSELAVKHHAVFEKILKLVVK